MQNTYFIIEHKKPVRVDQFCSSLDSFSDEYRRYAALHADTKDADAELFIEEIQKGSILIKLIELTPYVIPIVENASSVCDFITNFKDTITWLKGGAKPKEEITAEQLENILRVAKPVADNSSTAISIGNGNTFNAPINIVINSNDAKEVCSKALFELKNLGQEETKLLENTALTWYQARNDPKSKSGDRAIIQLISSTSVKTVFTNEELKSAIISDKANIFKNIYFVDILVHLRGGKPVKYQIINFRNKRPLKSA